MAGAKMQRLQLYLGQTQVDPLRYLAHRRGLSMSELIRQGIDKILADAAPEEDPLIDIMTAGPPAGSQTASR